LGKTGTATLFTVVRAGNSVMYVMIDNYDSFTYNLVHYLGELGAEMRVIRNDAMSVAEIMEMQPDGIVISPGPGTPDEGGVSVDLVKAALETDTPLLGVCLGHQSIGQALGASIVRSPAILHGKTSKVSHENDSVFKDLPTPFTATRYHSLTIDPATVPDSLKVTAMADDGVIMGVTHREKPVFGVQFHPESIATEHGHKLLDNFLSYTRQ